MVKNNSRQVIAWLGFLGGGPIKSYHIRGLGEIEDEHIESAEGVLKG
jgi:uncharacterized membrane protein YhiD involved in acid resistance